MGIRIRPLNGPAYRTVRDVQRGWMQGDPFLVDDHGSPRNGDILTVHDLPPASDVQILLPDGRYLNYPWIAESPPYE